MRMENVGGVQNNTHTHTPRGSMVKADILFKSIISVPSLFKVDKVYKYWLFKRKNDFGLAA